MILNNNLNLLQWNCKSLRHKLLELNKYIMEFDIFFLSETWLNSLDSITIKGFDIIKKDRVGRRGGGVAIRIKDGIKYSERTQIFNCNGAIEACAIDLFMNSGKITIVSCYRLLDSPRMEPSDWRKFFEHQCRSSLGRISTPTTTCGEIHVKTALGY